MIKECGVKGVLGKERRVKNVGDRTSRVDEPGTEKKPRQREGKKPYPQCGVLSVMNFVWCPKATMLFSNFVVGFLLFETEPETETETETRNRIVGF